MSFVVYFGYGHGYEMPWRHTWPLLSEVAARYEESAKLIPVEHSKTRLIPFLQQLQQIIAERRRSDLSTCVTLHVDCGATVANYCSLVSLRVINST